MKALFGVAACMMLVACGKPDKPAEPEKAALQDISACGGFADNLPLPGEADSQLVYASAKNAEIQCQVALRGSAGTTCSDYVQSRVSYADALATAIDDPKPSNVQRAQNLYTGMKGTGCAAAGKI